jgi:hypothetical protein
MLIEALIKIEFFITFLFSISINIISLLTLLEKYNEFSLENQEYVAY